MGLSTTYTKAETGFLLQQIDKKVVGGYKGDLRISDPAPTEIGYYMLLDVGTYANLGGLNAVLNRLNFVSFDGTTWSKVEVEIPKAKDGTNGIDGKTIENWSAKSYAVGSNVFYNGKIYANDTIVTNAEDVPGSSPISPWIDKSSTMLLKNDNVDFSLEDEEGNKLLILNDGHLMTKNFNSKINKSLKIFFLGNSFTRDAVMYAPALLKSIDPSIDLTVGIGYVSGSSLALHWLYAQNSQASYAYDLSVSGNPWITVGGKSFEQMLADKDWDIVVFQQQSVASRDYTTFQPYLNNLVDFVYAKNDNVKLGWLFTPALPTGGIGIPSGMSSYAFFEDMANAVKRVDGETAIQVLFPCGTAIQNARTTSLNNLGEFGQLSFEGQHLDEGIARQIESYALCETILKLVASNKSIFGNKVRITEDFLNQNNIVRIDSIPTGSTDENCLIAQKSAIMAVKKPYEITTINF